MYVCLKIYYHIKFQDSILKDPSVGFNSVVFTTFMLVMFMLGIKLWDSV